VHGVNPILGYAFLALVGVLAWRLLGVPVWRFLRMPAVLAPPKLPAKAEEWTAAHVKARVDFLSRYLSGLRRNPRLAQTADRVRSAAEDLAALRERLSGLDAKTARAELARFEHVKVEPLLRALDREVDRLIRAEALSVGVATAVSPNGTLDAFIVLWRNANLVSRIANVYYGRPGVRGSFRILRDVSAAALLATYLEGLTEAAGGVLRGIFGSVVGVVAGPLLDGGINAVATLRIGYIAKARCRSFAAWTETTRAQALHDALAAAKDRSKEVIAELAKEAGVGIAGAAGKVGGAVKEGLAGLLRKLRGEEGEGPAPAG
jgi:hypothetical protein